MTHFRLLFPEGLDGRYTTHAAAMEAVEVSRQYGDDPSIVEVPGHYVGPQEYGGGGTVDGVPLDKLPQ